MIFIKKDVMRFKVNNLRVKGLLTEDTYQEGFSKIKEGDVLEIKTGGGVYKVKVVDVFSGQIIVNIKGQNYLLTSNSLNGNNLNTRRFIKGGKDKTVEGPTIKGVYNIVIFRDGDPLTSITTDKGRDKSVKKNISKKSKRDVLRYKELKSVIDNLKDNDVVVFTLGKMITKGRDKGSLAKNTTADLSFIVKKPNNQKIKLILKELSGNASDKYEYLKKTPIFIDRNSLKPLSDGIVLNYTFVDKNGSRVKGSLKNIFGVENTGMVEPKVPVDSDVDSGLTNSEKLDIIRSSPSLRRRYMGEPSLFNKLFRRKRLLPLGDINKLLGTTDNVLSNIKKGSKVEFKYYGDDIDITKDLYLQNKEKYAGKYLGDSKILIKSSNRKDGVEFKILGEISKDGVAVVDVKHKYVKDNIPNVRKLKRSKIKIIENK